MNLTRLALKRPVSVCITILALVVFGFSSILSSPLELMPNIEMPVMMVLTSYPGAGPEEVEDLVTSEIEDAVSTLSGLDQTISSSRENISIVVVSLEYGTNMDLAHMELQELLDRNKPSLPDDAEDQIILEMNMNSQAAITLSAMPTGDVNILSLIDEEVTPEIEKLSAVASVDVYGGQEDYISVQLDPRKMKQFNLDMNTVISVVSASDFSIPIGDVDRGDLEMGLRGGVDYKTTQSLREIPFTLHSGDVVLLSDFATVYENTKERETISRYNGYDNIQLHVTKRDGASTVDVCKDVVKVVDELNARDLGLQLSVINDSSEDIKSAIWTVFETLIMGVILAMFVLFIFLGDWRASVIVGVSMPVSLLVTLIIMNMMDISLNMVSMGGLVIGVGMMVDNSIVVLESIFSSREKQRSYKEAATEGAGLVTASVIAGTITTIVVFLPVSLLQGLSGQMFRQLGYTIIFSLTASLISALTLVPLMFVTMKPTEKKDIPVNRMLVGVLEKYGKFVRKSLNHRKTVVFTAVVLLVISLAMAPMLNVELMAATDEGTISVEVETRKGLNLEELDKIMSVYEKEVAKHPDVKSYAISAGTNILGNSTCSVTAYLLDDREMSTAEIVDQWREELPSLPNCNVSVSSASSSSMTSTDAEIMLQGNDLDELGEFSKKVEEIMRAHPGILRVTSDFTSGAPQAEVKVDPLKAHAIGYTPQQVVGILYNTISGKEATTIRQNGQEYSVFVEYPADEYDNISDLSGLVLTAPSGQQVPLLDIASIEYSNAPQEIAKQDGRYNITITGQTSSAAEFTAEAEIMAEVEKLDFPLGIEIAQNARQEAMAEEFTALGGAILTSVFLVFMVMAMQFESPRFSIMVMLCMPFCLIGSFACLLLANATVSMPTLIGFLMLVGTAVNSGILLVDTIGIYRETMDMETAIVEAGKSRLRPILMTTFTTVLSMIPMGIGFGDNGEIMQGLALVIIGGLITNTVLTLVILPTIYTIITPDPNKPKKPKKGAGKNDEDDEETPQGADLNNKQLADAINQLELPSADA